ncbi:MAG: YncE family protein [Bacteroidota bacterium]|jgi:hypothetical protein
MNYPRILLSIVLSQFLLISCEKEPDRSNDSVPPSLKGVFCINEGAFLASNGGVTFWPSDGSAGVVDLFSTANGFPAGDVLQSMRIHNGRAYLCVNNSQKIEVVSMADFKRLGTISGIAGPRYFLGLNDSLGVVSDWVSNQVYLIHLNSFAPIDSLACGTGPDQMALVNNLLFVCNSGGFGEDSSITIINTNSFSVQATIQTPVNPASIKTTTNGDLLVLCKGSLGDDFTPSPDDPGGAILRINPTSLSVTDSIQYNWDQHPLQLQLSQDNTTAYFLMGTGAYTGKIVKQSATDFNQAHQELSNREFYSLGLETDGTRLYAGKASFSANTHTLRYTTQGSIIDSLPCGIAPNGFVFNP